MNLQLIGFAPRGRKWLPSPAPYWPRRSLAELIQRTGKSPRWLQRWFKEQIGAPPRTYLRLLRFPDTFVGIAESEDSLADRAAAHGFADQAHMAREFRSMAGAPAKGAGNRSPTVLIAADKPNLTIRA